MKLLILDNYDSFTFNLVELIRKIGVSNYEVEKSGELRIEKVAGFDKILFTPGPGLPKDFPSMFEILQKYSSTKSILGVCLGHQAIGEYFGAELINLNNVVHGISKPARVIDTNGRLFKGFPEVINVGLYHSWFLSKENFPQQLKITAETDDNVIMALSHRTLDLHGVQFHPESIMTPLGEAIIRNWLGL